MVPHELRGPRLRPGPSPCAKCEKILFPNGFHDFHDFQDFPPPGDIKTKNPTYFIRFLLSPPGLIKTEFYQGFSMIFLNSMLFCHFLANDSVQRMIWIPYDQ